MASSNADSETAGYSEWLENIRFWSRAMIVDYSASNNSIKAVQ